MLGICAGRPAPDAAPAQSNVKFDARACGRTVLCLLHQHESCWVGSQQPTAQRPAWVGGRPGGRRDKWAAQERQARPTAAGGAATHLRHITLRV
jgi:hypothetical protein